jgi:hypothetical protein
MKFGFLSAHVVFVIQFIHGVGKTVDVSVNDIGGDKFRFLFLYFEKQCNSAVYHFQLSWKDRLGEGVEVSLETVALALVELQEGFFGVDRNLVLYPIPKAGSRGEELFSDVLGKRKLELVNDVLINQIKQVGAVTTELFLSAERTQDFLQPLKEIASTLHLDFVLLVADIHVEVILSESSLAVNSGGPGRGFRRMGFRISDVNVRKIMSHYVSSRVALS